MALEDNAILIQLIIVYIVLKIYKIPKNEIIKIESYKNHSGSNSDTISKDTKLDRKEVDKFLDELKKKDELILKKEEKQNLQNREISLIKQRVGDLRNDLLVMRNNEKAQIESLVKDNMDSEEDFGDIGSATNNMEGNNMEGNNKSNKKDKKTGKSYNLNFNLD